MGLMLGYFGSNDVIKHRDRMKSLDSHDEILSNRVAFLKQVVFGGTTTGNVIVPVVAPLRQGGSGAEVGQDVLQMGRGTW